MKQQTLAMAADQNSVFERHRRPTKRDEFLATMDSIVPWGELCAVIEPHYPKVGNGQAADRPGAHVADVLRAALVQSGR
jgi:IS5 family transposase